MKVSYENCTTSKSQIGTDLSGCRCTALDKSHGGSSGSEEENELHIDLLEAKMIGSMYGVVDDDSNCFLSLNELRSSLLMYFD